MRTIAQSVSRCEPAVSVLPWLVPASLSVWLKFRIVNSDAVRESVLGVRSSGVLSVWEKAALLRWDIAVGFVLVPLLLIAVGLLVPRRWRAALSGLLAAMVAIVLIVEETARAASGGFVSLRMLGRAADWVFRSHDPSLLYMPVENRVALLVSIALVIAAVVVVARASEPTMRRLNGITAMSLIAGACAALALSAVNAPKVFWDQPMLLAVAHAAIDAPAEKASASTTEKTGPSLAELRDRHRRLSQLPDPQPSPWTGKANGYNVVFFIMETAPAQVFDPARDDLRDMPNLRRLRQNSFVATSHFTTLPLSSTALFSMFTSTYARGSEAVGASLAEDVHLPGMVRDLDAAGYDTAYYGFVWRAHRERDDRMFASLGFKHVNEASINPDEDREGKSTFKGPIEYVEGHDRELLGKLRHDIQDWTSSRQKFAAVFFPQLGHDPWRELKGSRARTLMERGHALVVHEDAWLGELLAELEGDGAAGNTIVVVTSDHGLRTNEDPEQKALHLVTTRGDDIMIRVPLLIYVPKVLARQVRIEWPTSHIDLPPTILDLVGVAHDRAAEQGVDIWNTGLEHRRLFLAMDFFGVQTGYTEAGAYYMRSRSQTVFKSTRAHFEDRDALLQNSPESARVGKILDEHDTLLQALLARLFAGEPERSPVATARPR
jgi:arylsulfatase A-like enzyme